MLPLKKVLSYVALGALIGTASSELIFWMWGPHHVREASLSFLAALLLVNIGFAIWVKRTQRQLHARMKTLYEKIDVMELERMYQSEDDR